MPPQSPKDLVRPPEKIAETLAGLAHNLAASTVGTTLDRHKQLVDQIGGSIDEGAGPFDDVDIADDRPLNPGEIHAVSEYGYAVAPPPTAPPPTKRGKRVP